ncbi:uncharacterized protein LOC119769645 [Culex quinquefasciatus]|uniref:uncharacterized protein LOC119769645 n=1 Tax=Culex quinquefasciatus TaxID=7176 RepID=UPI0018E29B16|nr:uncharacterized protein LOC119769645 [Culex quinquefasciatus]
MTRTMGRWDEGVQKGEVEDRWENPAIATVTFEVEDPVDAIPEKSRPTIWRSGRKQEEPALICGHPEPLGVRTLRVQAGTDAFVRRKPPDTRGIPRAVHHTAEHDRSRTRIARDTVPVWEPPSRRRHFGLWTNRREIRRQPRQPLYQPTPETRQTGGFDRPSLGQGKQATVQRFMPSHGSGSTCEML